MILQLLASAVTTVWGMPVSWGDLVGFVTGLLCVYLTVRGSIWNFPTGIANSLVLGLVFFHQRLFSDASLQVVFIVLSIQGWWLWARGGEKTEIRVTRSNGGEWFGMVVVTAAIWFVLWKLMVLLKGAAPPLDALITSMSLSAQWLLNRKKLDSWYWWIAVDLVSVPLYWSRGLYLISLLYLVFLALCVSGFVAWRRKLVV